MGARLVGIRGPLSGSAIELEAAEVTVGREEANRIVVRDSSVSRRHCVLHREAVGHRLVDLGSRHGTLVNGVRSESCLLVPGDRISMGRAAFVYVDDAGAPGPLSLEVVDGDMTVDDSRNLKVEDSLFLRPAALFPALDESPRVASGLDTLRRIGEAIGQPAEPETLARRLLELIFAEVPAERGAILMVGPESSSPGAAQAGLETRPVQSVFDPGPAPAAVGEGRVSAGVEEDHAGHKDAGFSAVYTHGSASGAERRVRVSRSVAARVRKERVAVLENGVHETPWGEVPSLVEGRVRSVLCVPVTLHDRVGAVLYLDSSREGSAFDREHLELVTAVASIAALPLLAPGLAAPRLDGDSGSLVIRRSPAPAAEPASSPGAVPPAVPVELKDPLVIAFRPGEPLALAAALVLVAPLGLVSPELHPRVSLLLDWSGPPAKDGEPLPDSWLDRLAILPEPADATVARVSGVPSFARLAAVLAAASRPERRAAPRVDPRGRGPHPGPSGRGPADARIWFQDILLASALVAMRAAFAVIEPRGAAAGGGAPDDEVGPGLELAREYASRISKAFPGACIRPSPLAGSTPRLHPLDGEGAAGLRGVILISDSPDVVARKIRSAKTDGRVALDPEAELAPPVVNLLLLHHALSGESTTRLLARLAGKGYRELKEDLVEAAQAYLEPVRKRRAELAQNRDLAASLRRQSLSLEPLGARLAEAIARSPGVAA